MSKIVDKLWFTNMKGTLGIVVLEEDITNERKAYIGVVSGNDEKADTEDIISWGNKFDVETLDRLEHHLCRRRG